MGAAGVTDAAGQGLKAADFCRLGSVSTSPNSAQNGLPSQQNDILCDFGSQGWRFEPVRVQMVGKNDLKALHPSKNEHI
jgi:hypothetical protein